jgi:uncharacterized protein YbjQ (UPF0145 family)
MILTTTDGVPGRAIAETFGLVRGSAVRSAHLGHDVMAKLKNLVGGEVPSTRSSWPRCASKRSTA